MTCCTVSEIHAYPVNPPCHQEVLFDLPESKREVADHLLKASWLCRASEMKVRRGGSGDSAHVLREVVEVRRKGEGVEVLRQDDWRRHAWKKRVVEEVLDRWREVGDWWDENLRVDRLVFRVLLSCGSVIDLSRSASGEWVLAGVVD
jgi:hypothetical protein